jgi:AraC-like DNA-binding protein
MDTWRAMLRDCIVELDAAPVGGAAPAVEDYTGWVYLVDLGPLSITDVGTDPARVARTARTIGRSQDDFYHLSVAQRPCWSGQAEHETRMGPGDAVLLDCTMPFWLTADGFAHHVVVNVPKAALRHTLRVERDLLGRRIAADNPVLRVLMAAVAELGKDPAAVPPGMAPEIGHTLTELLVSTLRLEKSGRPAGAGASLGRHAQLLRMQDFVRRHLADPDLSTRTLADAFDVSVRYVELVFRDGGLSPSRFIRETRMDEARRILGDPRQRHRSVAAVARSVGIDNASVFARTFRARYDITPREYRQSGVSPRTDAM